MGIKLYSTGHCEDSKPVIERLRRYGLVYEPIDPDTPIGALRASEKGVKETPTLDMWGIYHAGKEDCLKAINGTYVEEDDENT
jgi:hypothetical protein